MRVQFRTAELPQKGMNDGLSTFVECDVYVDLSLYATLVGDALGPGAVRLEKSGMRRNANARIERNANQFPII